ncbi:MAG: NAD(P)-dependent oxidoreductase [Spirochaetales bacterium]|nr:NAD(P)-dependent oxidoreductase [Spirochaetales bacterium]
MGSERVLLTGCGGMLGDAVFRVCSEEFDEVLATDIDLNESWLKPMDVRDIDQCEKVFTDFKPTLVIHLAALTDLEYCENNNENSWITNALGTENIGFLCKKYDATMVYISTAGIFGGKQEYFTDFDEPNPLSHYAKSKYYGECFVQKYLAKHFVFRAGWMMGGGIKKDKKFVKKIFDQIKNGKKELFIVDDKLGTPTYTVDFARSLLKVIRTKNYDLYNQVCNGSCSRLDFAKEFIKLLGLEKEIKITNVSSDFFKEEYFAPRPYSEKLVNLKLKSRNLDYMRNWKECLKEYSREFKI